MLDAGAVISVGGQHIIVGTQEEERRKKMIDE